MTDNSLPTSPTTRAMPRFGSACTSLAALLLAGLAGCGSADGYSPSLGGAASNHIIQVIPTERLVRVETDGRGGARVPMPGGWRSVALDHARRGRGPVVVAGNRSDAQAVAAELVAAGVPAADLRVEVLGRGREDWGRRADVSYPVFEARIPVCGNFLSDTETLFTQWTNRGTSNLGCAMQRNTAAMLSDPGDLVAARGDQPFSTQRAVGRIGDYNTYERPRDLPLQGGTAVPVR